MTISFKIPITPTAQLRPRFSKWGTHKSDNQLANERSLEAWLKDYVPKTPIEGAIALTFVAALPVPKSAGKKQKHNMLSGKEYPTKKPDLDNLAKQLKDAMTRMQFWHDDKQIISLNAVKIYSETGFWDITVGDIFYLNRINN